VAPDHVLERGQVREQPDVLERPRDAALGDLIRLEPGERLAVEDELAFVLLIDAGQHVEQASLAGAVGADQPVDLAVADREADIRERMHPAEALADPLREQGQPAVGVSHAGAFGV
jgi:hypothetical protein